MTVLVCKSCKREYPPEQDFNYCPACQGDLEEREVEWICDKPGNQPCSNYPSQLCIDNFCSYIRYEIIQPEEGSIRLTQYYGVYCSLCRIRYVAHMMFKDDGPICQHQYGRATKLGVVSPAIFIYSHAWRYHGGYQRFLLQQLVYKNDEEKNIWRTEFIDPGFEIKYANRDQLNTSFLEFLRKIPSHDWPIWTSAFHFLDMGLAGIKYPPNWRCRQIERMKLPMEAQV